jgi:hypothetical protein
MVLFALALWLALTVVLAVPISLVLRRFDALDVEEPVDQVELAQAITRHPSHRHRAA